MVISALLLLVRKEALAVLNWLCGCIGLSSGRKNLSCL
jgi:hypothetical protein